MNLRLFIISVITLILTIFFTPGVFATMGGVPTVGPLFSQGESSTAIRELVELERSGELLIAKPQHAFVEMITLHAPGLDDGHLILRELLTQEGQQTLLLTAPEKVITHIDRVTLYTRGLEEHIALYEHIDGEWVKHLPQPMLIDLPKEDGTSEHSLRAFSVKNLGFYWLLNPSMATELQTQSSDAISPRTLMGGKVIPGILPSIFGILLFMVCGVLSRHIHKTAKLREL